MAWENRGENKYYYRKRRHAGRVVSEYVGRGWLAEMQAEIDGLTQAEREAERAQREAERAIDRQIDKAIGSGRQLVAAALLASGYYRHKGQWRRRRRGDSQTAG